MTVEQTKPPLATEMAQGFWQIATNKLVVKRATRIALIVGTILAIINHGDRMLFGDMTMGSAFKIVLTYFVPYSVSTYSAVQSIRERQLIEGNTRK